MCSCSANGWRVLTIERFRGNWPIQRRKKNSSKVEIPYHRDERQWPRPATQRPAGILELIGSDKCSANYWIISVNTESRHIVRRRNLQQIKAYAVIVGTPAALTRDVKATGDGKMVHSNKAATVYMTVMAL